MNWPDERYVRLYTRDTPDWLLFSFFAQGLLCLLLRKVDRAGVLPLGKHGRRAVFVAIGHPHLAATLDPALDELLTDGCIEIHGDQLLVPNFIEAQEAEASDRARARKHREKVRDLARAKATVTPCDATVTPCDATVTPNRAVPPVPAVPPEEKLRLAPLDGFVEKPPKKPKKAKAPTDPRLAELRVKLIATFADVKRTAYGFNGRDAKALADLLSISCGDISEIDRRWRRALVRGEKWPGCATIALLPGRWNELALGIAPDKKHDARRERLETAIAQAPCPEWAAILRAADNVNSETFRDDLEGAQVERVGEELLVTPADGFAANRLTDPEMFGGRLDALAAEAAPEVRVRLVGDCRERSASGVAP